MLNIDDITKYIKEYRFNVAFDFTNAPVGDLFRNYTEPMSICPHCSRVGQKFEGMYLHVIVMTEDENGILHEPTFIADLCQSDGEFIITDIAKSLSKRIKHPKE